MNSPAPHRLLTAALAFVIAALGMRSLPAFAFTATGLSSFEAIEEPRVRFAPASATFTPDDFINITEVGEGTFRFLTRYRDDAWDGDRDTVNQDRQRAEVKGLGPHQQDGETFFYTTTWRTNPEFRATDRFCHVFQLKSIDGDSGPPLVVLSIIGSNRAAVRYWPAHARTFIVVREFAWTPNEWQTVELRVKTTATTAGEIMVSVDGDDFRGLESVAVNRPGATAYRPKWGLYRGARPGMKMGDDFVEHRAVSAQRAGAARRDNVGIETEARTRIRVQKHAPGRALNDVLRLPASAARDFAAVSLAVLALDGKFPAALDWAAKQKDARVRDDAILRLFSRWTDSDGPAALAWLKSRTPDPSLDLIAWLFVTDTTYRYVKRELALTAAPLIHDPKLRADAFEHVLAIWIRTDRPAALAFLEQTPALTADQKTTLAAKFAK